MLLQFNFNALSFILLLFVLIFNAAIVPSEAQNSSSLSGAAETTETENEWEAPLRVQKLFPYYLSGFDDEGRPIITLHYGEWDIRKFLEEGGSNFEILGKYLQQFIERSYKSPKNFPQSRDINQFIFMVNLDGYDLHQLSHLPSLQSALGIARNLFRVERQESRLYRTVVVNANFVFQTLFSIGKPILGNLGSLFEIYGSNPDVWKPAVFRLAPRSQLPEFLGGFANHTQVQVWG